MAVGAVQFGTYIATSLIAAGSISGIGGGIVSATVFFVFGQLSLLLFGFIHEKQMVTQFIMNLKSRILQQVLHFLER